MRYRLKDISDVSKLNLNKTIMEKQILETAVEFYAEQEVKLTLDFISNKLNELEYGIKRIELLKQAKEMEKEQKGYSEKECYKILHNLMTDIKLQGLRINDDIDLKNWFEQNKK